MLRDRSVVAARKPSCSELDSLGARAAPSRRADRILTRASAPLCCCRHGRFAITLSINRRPPSIPTAADAAMPCRPRQRRRCASESVDENPNAPRRGGSRNSVRASSPNVRRAPNLVADATPVSWRYGQRSPVTESRTPTRSQAHGIACCRLEDLRAGSGASKSTVRRRPLSNDVLLASLLRRPCSNTIWLARWEDDTRLLAAFDRGASERKTNWSRIGPSPTARDARSPIDSTCVRRCPMPRRPVVQERR